MLCRRFKSRRMNIREDILSSDSVDNASASTWVGFGREGFISGSLSVIWRITKSGSSQSARFSVILPIKKLHNNYKWLARIFGFRATDFLWEKSDITIG